MKFKTFHLLIVYMFLFCQVINAQEWAPIGAKWYYSNHENPLGGPEQGYLLIESTGDTTINDIAVRKLKRTYFSSDGNNYESGFDFVYSIDNKVYYLKEATSYLLYDFNAETGDTLKFREPYFTGTSTDSTFSLIVDSTNFIAINGINLKVIYLSNLNHILGQWDLYNIHIERIGNTTYMFPQSSLDCDWQCFDPLRCYTDDMINYKGLSWPYDCDKIITSVVNKYPSDIYRIFPNPANSFIRIEVYTEPVEPMSIKIYDVSGRCILFYEEKVYSGRIDIDLTSVPSGLYIITINNHWRDKIFKQ